MLLDNKLEQFFSFFQIGWRLLCVQLLQTAPAGASRFNTFAANFSATFFSLTQVLILLGVYASLVTVTLIRPMPQVKDMQEIIERLERGEMRLVTHEKFDWLMAALEAPRVNLHSAFSANFTTAN